MNVRNTGAASVVVVGSIGAANVASPGGQTAVTNDLLVEIFNFGNIEELGARLDPIFGDLTSLVLRDRYDVVAELLEKTDHFCMSPAIGAHLLPLLHVHVKGHK
jgi:hypothetical protein